MAEAAAEAAAAAHMGQQWPGLQLWQRPAAHRGRQLTVRPVSRLPERGQRKTVEAVFYGSSLDRGLRAGWRRHRRTLDDLLVKQRSTRLPNSGDLLRCSPLGAVAAHAREGEAASITQYTRYGSSDRMVEDKFCACTRLPRSSVLAGRTRSTCFH